MIKVVIKTTTLRREVTANLDDTPLKVFGDYGVDIDSGIINLDGAPLSHAEVNTSFEELGVQEGATCSLNCIVKAYGA